MRSARAACSPCYGKLETVFAVEFKSARGANLGSHSNSQSVLLQIVSTGRLFSRTQESRQDSQKN
jgi:hypothetical protein